MTLLALVPIFFQQIKKLPKHNVIKTKYLLWHTIFISDKDVYSFIYDNLTLKKALDEGFKKG